MLTNIRLNNEPSRPIGYAVYITNLMVAIDDNLCINVINESSVVLSFNKNSFTLVERSEHLLAYYLTLMAEKPPYLIDCILSYDTLLIEFDCLKFDHYYVISQLKLLKTVTHQKTESHHARIHEVDVCYQYNSKHCPNDMEIVSNFLKLSRSQIIDLHTNIQFMVFAIGFMPNFAYLGELPEKINMPRLPKPRLKVPAGAVAIADNQTAIYPNVSPGGWHIIGYAPSFLCSKTQIEFKMSDKIIFKSIDEKAFFDQVNCLPEAKIKI